VAVSSALTIAETEQVRTFARGHHVTVGTVLQAAWALLLARLSGRPEVVFGTTRSGRSGQVPGLDRVVGMLMNTVPTRVRMIEKPIGDWLRDLQAANIAAQRYEHWSLAQVQRAAGISGRPLFHSIFVYENFSTPDHADPTGLRVWLDDIRRQTGYPLVLGASLHDEVTLRLDADLTRLTHDSAANEILAAYREVLTELLAPTARLADLAPTVDPGAAIAPAPAAPGPLRRAAYRPPQDGTERMLAEIWAAVLGLPRVGVDDDFLDLGGDSMLAMQIVARARDAGLVWRPSDVFRYPTIAQLAARATGATSATTERREADTGTAEPSEDEPMGRPPARFPLAGLDEPTLAELLSTLDMDEIEDIYRLTPTQVGMLFQRLAGAGEDIYFRQRVVDLRGELDVTAFRLAWQHLVDRHPALRTRFAWDGLPHPVQIVARRSPVTIEERDARHLPEAERARWLEDLLAQERARGIDLGATPQRLVLVRTGERTHRFIVNTHHLVLDGWSHAIISRELINAYTAFAAGHRPPDSGEAVPIRDYFAWLDGRGADPGYWRRAFDGWPGATPLPFARDRDGSGQDGTALDQRTIPDELAGRLRELARTNRVTLHTVLRCAWGLLLSRHSGRPTVAFGTMLAGRSAEVPNIERVVGMLMNTLPTVVRADPTVTVGEWLRRGYEQQLELDDHAHCTLGEVRRAARITGAMFESLFIFNNVSAEPPIAESALTWIDIDPPVGGAGYPLVLTVEQGQTLSVAAKYERARYDAASASLVLEEYVGLLAALAEAGSDAPVGALASPEPATRDTAERVLHRVWASVLGADVIEPHEDFFELGGDSILAFEVVARARRAGLPITVQDMVAYRTIAGLTAYLDGTAPSVAPPSLGAAFLPRLRPDAPELLAAMAGHGVPAVSVAILEDGQLTRAFGVGTTRLDGSEPVDPRTPFRACSISKHVTAVGVLRLVHEGVLHLDADVRDYQTSWRLSVPPDAPPITLRRLLNHTAGLNPEPSVGYRRDEPLPSLLDLLTGARPAKSAPVRLQLTPGARFRYARAHYLVIQQILTDVTGRRFDELMHELVLAPLGMHDSSFDQTFPQRRAVALGHEPGGDGQADGWLLYPELAPSGLWTTPSDLARLAVEIRRAASGDPGAAVLTADTAAEMLRAIPGAGYGLGSIAVAHTGRRWFGHAGDDLTYQSLSIANLDDGSGLVIMANTGGGTRFIVDVLTAMEFSVPPSPEGRP
jgi:CubicO group peptidase (beta-lactamase class C family)